MAYTNKALAVVWVVALVLFVLSGSGMVSGLWVLSLAALALVLPTVILTVFPRPAFVVGALTAAYAGVLVAPAAAAKVGPSAVGADVPRWETDGGATRTLADAAVPMALPTLAAPSVESPAHYRLRAIIRQGTAASLPAVWERYATLDDARAAVRGMYASDRVVRVNVVTDDVPPRFVEWVER